jgi:hypothetical protein
MPEKVDHRTLTISEELYEQLNRLRERRRKLLRHEELSWNNFLHEMSVAIDGWIKNLESGVSR